jgi:hypothetical protein
MEGCHSLVRIALEENKSLDEKNIKNFQDHLRLRRKDQS